MIMVGPAAIAGWPARNPALRLFEADPDLNWALLDGITYTADVEAANRAGSNELEWWQLFSYKDDWGLGSRVSDPLAWVELAEEMAANGSTLWKAYRGGENQVLYCTGYDESKTPFPPRSPCQPTGCNGICKSGWVDWMNGTDDEWFGAADEVSMIV